MEFKRRRNLANRGINGWFSILVGRYKLQDHMSMDTALECSYTDTSIILKIIRYNIFILFYFSSLFF